MGRKVTVRDRARRTTVDERPTSDVLRPTSPAVDRLTTAAKAAALNQGFDAVGICGLEPIERQTLADWLAHGYAATMTYMHRQAAKRAAPSRIVSGATRAVVVLKTYFTPAPPTVGTAARVARYAWGEDYHRVMGERLAALLETLVALGASREATRAYVDAGPVPERELAQRAGLGWIAKNTMLIHPRLGSFTFIGTVLTDLTLQVDAPFATDHCGSCRACLDACPTGAFPAEGLLDARRCISYLTIEHRSPFTAAEGAMIGQWLFGCDVCQDVCPWNEKFAAVTAEPRFAPRPAIVDPNLDELTTLDAASFDTSYADTAFERPGAAGIARNARQVLDNAARATRSRLVPPQG
jgi:epoxyqueuosine reductase